ncbi:MAG: hypothetical protein J6I62_11785 [Selenomonadaceae bacterium]|nr:hypothetical protein [Selenomonadaceae bacterium]
MTPMYFRIKTNSYTFEKDLPVENFDAYGVTKHVYLRDGEIKEKEYPHSAFIAIAVDKNTSKELDKIFATKDAGEDHEINSIKIGERKFYFKRSSCTINYLNNKAHIVVKDKE